VTARIRAALVVVAVLAACSGTGSSSDVTAPEGATFCSVFEGEYQTALSNAVPVTDDAFDERADELVVWAEILSELAPDDLAAEADDNVGYHRAQREGRSAADFVAGSNALHAYARANC
jgi:ABC-type glycerol-3-phosphate transport system substrate-binding protein